MRKCTARIGGQERAVSPAPGAAAEKDIFSSSMERADSRRREQVVADDTHRPSRAQRSERAALLTKCRCPRALMDDGAEGVGTELGPPPRSKGRRFGSAVTALGGPLCRACGSQGTRGRTSRLDRTLRVRPLCVPAIARPGPSSGKGHVLFRN